MLGLRKLKSAPASPEEILALLKLGEATAQRLREQGWPKVTMWPPFRSRSRFDYQSEKRMRYVDGSGPWLCEDGTFRGMMSLNGCVYFGPWPLTAVVWPSRKRIAKIAQQLEKLERKSA